jgi:hypothetical protein
VTAKRPGEPHVGVERADDAAVLQLADPIDGDHRALAERFPGEAGVLAQQEGRFAPTEQPLAVISGDRAGWQRRDSRRARGLFTFS